MKAVITPAPLKGVIAAIPSKSHVHRLLICAALSDQPVTLGCRVVSEDIAATARCLEALGASVTFGEGTVAVSPIGAPKDRAALPREAELDPGESGSTYRFITPLAPALGRKATFRLHGKLPSRPMDALWDEMERHGAAVSGKGTDHPVIEGMLTSGEYTLPGDVSSQFFSGLLFALPLLEGRSRIVVTGKMESLGYINMTIDALRAFGVAVSFDGQRFTVAGGQRYVAPDSLSAEGDWSNSAFWLCAGAALESITVTGLKRPSLQGDSAVTEILRRMGASVTAEGSHITAAHGELQGLSIDAGDTPDLVPALAVAAAAVKGVTVIENAGRLRLKESDRIASVCAALNALGGSAAPDGDRIIITGTGRLRGGVVDACGDHRIAMLGAAASALCEDPVTIVGAEAVNKSYPGFFKDFALLGGKVRVE